eukprot:SAG31_NODE_1969_length_6771_cov_17.211331_6_plen_150_part_00
MSLLRKQALAARVQRAVLDAAADKQETKEAVIALLLAATTDDARPTVRQNRTVSFEDLNNELAAMKMSALRQRAMDNDVDDEAIDAADDSDALVLVQYRLQQFDRGPKYIRRRRGFKIHFDALANICAPLASQKLALTCCCTRPTTQSS